jgi:hypothetical protein
MLLEFLLCRNYCVAGNSAVVGALLFLVHNAHGMPFVTGTPAVAVVSAVGVGKSCVIYSSVAILTV